LSIPLIIIAEKYRKIRSLFLASIAALIIAQLGFAFLRADTVLLIVMFFTFFVGFNFLEAVQPSLVAKYADVDSKGTAMGVFSTSQFLGIFVGGIAGGWVQSHYGYTGVFLLGAGMAWLWVFIAFTLPQPNFYTTRRLKLAQSLLDNPEELTTKISQVIGVKEVSISQQEGIAYLKVDKKRVDEVALSTFSTITK
jgi:MFS family permease